MEKADKTIQLDERNKDSTSDHGCGLENSIDQPRMEFKNMLWESGINYHGILDSLLEGLQVIGSDFRYLYMNDVAARHGRRAKDELLGHTITEMYPGIENTEMFTQLQHCMRKRTSHRMINEFTFPDGTKSWFELSMQPVPEGILVLSWDITEYKRTKKIALDLINNSPVGIFITQDRKFKLANPRFQELIGYTEDELLRAEPLNIVYSEDRNKVRESAISMLKGKRFSPYEYRYFRKNGELRWVAEQVSSIQYQGKRAVLGSFMDITERKHAEEELRQTLKRLQKTIEGTISAVVAIVEARDPYTAGHQQRVAKLACAIAQEIRLPKKRVEAIRMAALIHDVGKIHIPAEILSKPGRLTETEFSLVKAHPQVAYDILKTVEFPWPVCQDVLQHHERLDGSGYPQGLSGKDILLGARILAVADVVEAISSHRPYRPSLGIDKALEEIAQNKDILYDSKVVDACLRLFHEKGFKFE